MLPLLVVVTIIDILAFGFGGVTVGGDKRGSFVVQGLKVRIKFGEAVKY